LLSELSYFLKAMTLYVLSMSFFTRFCVDGYSCISSLSM
jgi:hypothetical protein